jgi:hypothetical protein
MLEMRRGAVCVLIHSDAAMACDDAIGAGALHESLEQHHVQIAAVNRELRPLVARIAARGIAVDELAKAIVVGDFRCGDRDACERRE